MPIIQRLQKLNGRKFILHADHAPRNLQWIRVAGDLRMDCHFPSLRQSDAAANEYPPLSEIDQAARGLHGAAAELHLPLDDIAPLTPPLVSDNRVHELAALPKEVPALSQECLSAEPRLTLVVFTRPAACADISALRSKPSPARKVQEMQSIVNRQTFLPNYLE